MNFYKVKAGLKMLFFVLLLTSVNTITLYSQTSRYWTFGNNGGLQFSGPAAGLFTASSFDSQIGNNQGEGVATMTDIGGGQLLFSTDGISVFDANGLVFPSANGVLNGHTSSTQSAIIVPDPQNDQQYYIFTMDVPGGAYAGLQFSIFNPHTEDPLTQVITGSFPTPPTTLSNGTQFTEKLTAVKKPDEAGYWIVAHEFGADNNNFHVYDLSCGLDQTPNIISVGAPHDGGNNNRMGYMKFNSNGTQLAVAVTYGNSATASNASAFGFVQVFNFNNTTGTILSNPINIGMNGTLDGDDGATLLTPYGLEFSPSGNFLYISELAPAWHNQSNRNPQIHQVNLVNFNGTTRSVGFISGASTNNNYNFNNGPYMFGALQIGLDNRIYCAINNSTFLGVINFPNIQAFPGPPNFATSTPNQLGLFSNNGQTFSRLGLPSFVERIVMTEPNVDAGPDQLYCPSNGPLSLSPINPTATNNTYTWSIGGSTILSGPGAASPISVSPNATTTYTLSALDNLGCEHTDDVQVSLDYTPYTTATTGFPMCQNSGNSGSLFLANGNFPNLNIPIFGGTFVWNAPAPLPQNVNSYKYVINSSTPPGTYNIDLQWTSPSGCVINETFTVEIFDTPDVSMIDGSAFCEGSGLSPLNIDPSYTLSGSGISQSGGQWFFDASQAVGTYTIDVCNSFGCCTEFELIISPAFWHQTTATAADEDHTNDVITDSQGNVYVVGTFVSTTELNLYNPNGSPITLTNNLSSQESTTYLAKYSPCGDLIWATNAKAYNDNVGHSITLDELNNRLYITGYFSQYINFMSAGSSITASTTVSSSSIEGYVAQYDPFTGDIAFVENIRMPYDPSNSSGGFTECRAITVDQSNGDLYIGGRRGNNAYTITGVPTGGNSPRRYGYFANKYVPSATSIGAPVWSKHANYYIEDQINDIDYDEINNNLWVTGTMKKRLNNTVQWLTTGSLVHDGFIGSFTGATGAPLSVGGANSWRIGGCGPQGRMEGNAVSVDENTGVPYFTGSYKDFVINDPYKLKTPSVINAGVSFTNDNLPGFPPNYRAYFIKVDLYNQLAWCAYAKSQNFGGWPFGSTTAKDVFGKGISVKDNKVHFCGDTYSRRTLFVGAANTSPVNLNCPPGGAGSNVYTGAFDINSGQTVSNLNLAYGFRNIHAISMTTDHLGHAFYVGSYNRDLKVRNALLAINQPPASGTLISTPIGTQINGFILRGMLSNGHLKYSESDEEPIEADSNLGNFEVYPNPFGSELHIQRQGDRDLDYSFAVYNAMGSCIRPVEHVTSISHQFELTDVPTGMYFIKIHSEYGLEVIKVMKK